MGFVRGGVARPAGAGGGVYVRGSTSANTGVAPHCHTALAVAMNDSDGTMTSSPGPIPLAYSVSCSAVVQFVVATAWAARTLAANASSKACTRGPWETQPDA